MRWSNGTDDKFALVANLCQTTVANDTNTIRGVAGLVAFWDFQEKAGEKRISGEYALTEQNGPVETIEGGIFGPRSALIKRGQWFAIEREHLGRLDVHGEDAEVTVIAWIYRESKQPWQAIAGVWDETHRNRQYCLFLNAATATRSDEMKRYPVANRIHGHVSRNGGPTPGFPFCVTYSSGKTEIPLRQWCAVAMRYDGRESQVFINGHLDSWEFRNPFPYPVGLFDGGDDGAAFTVGAVHRGGEWGNFFGGRIGGLAVFDRALSDEELEKFGTPVEYQTTNSHLRNSD